MIFLIGILLTGRVESNGEPLNFSIVLLLKNAFDAPLYPYKWTYTFPDGRYKFSGLRAGETVYVYAEKGGYFPQWWYNADFPEDAVEIIITGEITDVSFNLSPNPDWHPATISGKVMDADSTPLKDATLILKFNDLYTVGTASTDENGEFIIDNIPPDTSKISHYTLEAFYKGLIINKIENLHLAPDENYYIEIYRQPSNLLNLTLTTNCSAYVFIASKTYCTIKKVDITDTLLLPEGNYRILAVANGYLPSIDSIFLKNDTSLILTFDSVNTGFSIEGYVEDSAPIYPAFVFAFDENSKFYCAITNRDGFYRLSGLHGEVYLYCFAKNHTGVLYPSTFNFQEAIKFSSSASNINFKLNRSKTGYFTLYGKLSYCKIQKIGIIIARNSKSVKTTLSDPYGNFYLTGLTPGLYKIYGNTPDFISDTVFAATFDESIPVVINEGVVPTYENKNKISRLKLIPNPAKDYIKINYKGNIEIFDITGRKICSLKNESGIIRISNLKEGIYFVRTQDNRVEKLIILR